MAERKSAVKTKMRTVSASGKRTGGIELYLKRIFALMFGAVGVTALAAFATMATPLWGMLFTETGMSALFYILMFGGMGLAIWAQVRAFSMKPAMAAGLLFLYAALVGVVLTPLLLLAVTHNPFTILAAFIIAALMFACMALFGYKTLKDLSFMRTFLFMGMIGLILVGLASFIWPALLGGTFGSIVCLIGVLVFALFTAYDMQTLKHAYAAIGNDYQKNQLAVLGALHLYISFIAMFQYILALLNRNN
ncbi:MAG: Bax inhibitor-1/YccA family protein [Alphaproteobacteria bacterium]|nr:Bax inhibitor-1/YccA family protein [Alphaproteobacteria bacterium]